MIQRWAQGKSFRCPAYIISFFFFFFFPCLKPAGLFRACNFAGTEGKARRFNAGENCFFEGGGGEHDCKETSSRRSEVCRFIGFAVLSSTPPLTARAHDVYTH